MIALPDWMSLGPDPRDDGDLPVDARRMTQGLRRTGFGCRFAGLEGDHEVYLVRDDRRGGSLVLDRRAGTLELWSPVDPNGAPRAWVRVDPARSDPVVDASDLLVSSWGRPRDLRAAVRLRPAVLRDADSIAAVHVHTWQHAYRGLLPDELLDSLDVGARAVGWRRDLDEVGGDRATTVAEDADRVIAFATVCGSRDDDSGHGVGELAALYVDPAAAGIGIGRLLVGDAVDRLRETGYTTATLWVLRDNVRAVGFYERMGWAADGSTKSADVRGVNIIESRLRRALGPPRA